MSSSRWRDASARTRDHADASASTSPPRGGSSTVPPSRWKARSELARTLADDRVLEEARAELLLGLALLLGKRLEARQEAPRLEQDEPRGEREERRDLVRGQRGHRAHARQVRVGEVPETHRDDVELLLLDELEKKIERPVESLDANPRGLRFHHGRAS